MALNAEVESILFETDSPEVVIARDAAGTAYLSLLVERSDSGDEFLCVPASQKRISALRNGRTDLRTALEHGETGIVYSARYVLLDDAPSFSLTRRDDIPGDWLPKADFLLSDFLPVIVQNLQALASDAIAKHSSVGILELHPPESEVAFSIDSHHLIDGLRLFQNLLHHAYNKAMAKADKLEKVMFGGDDASIFQVLPAFTEGSFRVHFQSKRKADLAGSTGVGIALAKVDELTRFIDSPEQAIEVMKQNRGHAVGAYKSLLQFVAMEKTPLVYSWSEPGIPAPKSCRIGIDAAQRFYEILTTKQELTSVERTFTGKFSRLHEDGAWLLISGKKRIRGVTTGENLLAGLTYQTKEYRIVCDEKLEEKVGSKPRTTLYLKQAPEPI